MTKTDAPKEIYTKDEVEEATLEYFKGDELAASVWVSKYALTDKEGRFYEKTPDDMHRRMAKEFARIEAKHGGDRQLGEDEIFGYFKDFKYISPQGSPMAGIGNDFVLSSLSNCVVIAPPEDTMSQIIDTGKDMANLFKRRCGVGTSISNLRPDGASVSNAAKTSSGAWSFADFYSYITRMVGQSGRRGALLVAMDVNHPDIEKFVTMKNDKTKVTGANVSIKISDAFMEAVDNDTDFTLQYPIDVPPEEATITRTIRAKDLWHKIIMSATKTAEPGLLMWDNILKMLPSECYADYGFKTEGTNPCGEQALGKNGSCRLLSQNLKWYVNNPFTAEASFDFDLFSKNTRVSQRLLDDMIDLELEKLDLIIESADTTDERELFMGLRSVCESGRRCGLGTHALADCIARLCLPYDSDEAIAMISKIYETQKVNSFRESVELAKERGAFPVWSWEIEKDNLFILGLPESLRSDIEKYGRRNISNLTNAPTGSVSIESQTSSGIEPVFRNSYLRRKKRNHNDTYLDTDTIDDMGDRWEEFEVHHKNVLDWQEITGGDLDDLPDYFTTSDQINWTKRIEVQAAIQEHVDNALSSTINLPKGTSEDVVGELYMDAWKKGLKGVTVYVDGSRSGVLISKDDKAEKKAEEFAQKSAPRRPDELDCDIHKVKVKGEQWVIFVGLMNGSPYEVFGGLSDNVEIPDDNTRGKIVKGASFKHAASRYDLEVNGFTIKNIVKQFDNPTYQVYTRMVSLGLRHGANPSYLTDQLLKDPDNDLTSFSRVLARVLKKYIKDGTKVTSDKMCGNCKTESLHYSDGCVICESCGWSKC